MSKATKIILIGSIVCMLWHCFIFAMNTEYRNRMNDKDYLQGNKVVCYYSTNPFAPFPAIISSMGR